MDTNIYDIHIHINRRQTGTSISSDDSILSSNSNTEKDKLLYLQMQMKKGGGKLTAADLKRMSSGAFTAQLGGMEQEEYENTGMYVLFIFRLIF